LDFNENEIVVIGEGIAGITATVNLIKNGKNPILISKSFGATAMFSGAYDIGNSSYKYRTLSESIQDITELNKYHPYNYIKDVKTVLNESFKLVDNCLKLNLSSVSFENPNLFMPTQYGNFKPTSVVDKNNIQIELKNMIDSGNSYAISSFDMFKNYHSQKLLNTLKDIAKSRNSITRFAPVKINFLKRNHDAYFQNHDFAQLLDSEKAFDKFITYLKKLSKQIDIKTIIIPPILGIEEYPKLFERIKEECDIDMCETISLTPSVPGIRLQKAVSKYIKQNKIRKINSKVVSFKQKDGEITHLTTQNGTEIPVCAVILATGKFIGGGIDVNQKPFESIFNLPVFYNNKGINNYSLDLMFDNDFFKNHKIYSTGVKINDKFKPVDVCNNVIYDNLFAAGNVLQGYNYLESHGGMGVAIATGYYSAQKLIEQLQG